MSSSAPPSLPPDDERSPYPGYGLGLPESGARSMGRFGRRLIALVIDWGIAVLISVLFFHYNSFATLGVFALLQMVFLITLGGSLGHIACRMRVVPLPTGYIGVWRPVVRTILLCLVIPAVIYDRDQRGLHDRAVGAVLVRI